jgi:uncharacterized membrane protein YbhN (UPF0104 family)
MMSGEGNLSAHRTAEADDDQDQDTASRTLSLVTVATTIIVIVFLASIFTLIASVITIAVFEIKPAYWLFGFYWALIAKFVLLAAQSEALCLSKRDAGLTPAERRLVVSLGLWLIRIEFAASVLLLIFSLVGHN